jgi:hypothetical protein
VFFPQIFLFLLYRELTQKMGRKNIPRTKSDLDLVRSPGRLADCIFPLIFSFYPGADRDRKMWWWCVCSFEWLYELLALVIVVQLKG